MPDITWARRRQRRLRSSMGRTSEFIANATTGALVGGMTGMVIDLMVGDLGSVLDGTVKGIVIGVGFVVIVEAIGAAMGPTGIITRFRKKRRVARNKRDAARRREEARRERRG